MRSAIRDIRDSLRWWGVSRIYTYGVASSLGYAGGGR